MVGPLMKRFYSTLYALFEEVSVLKGEVKKKKKRYVPDIVGIYI